MKGRYVCKCCACSKEKSASNPNHGWWVLYPRGTSIEGRNYCPDCAPGLLVRSDEVQTNPRAMTGLRIVTVSDLYAILSALRTATTDSIDPRSTIGWRAAEKVAKSIGFEDLPKAAQLREFGFLPGETP